MKHYLSQSALDSSVAIRAPSQQAALRSFGISISLLTVIGHGFLGFEQSIAQPLVAMLTAYSMQLTLEWTHALSIKATPRFSGGVKQLIDFLLPAHIVALSISMLLYFNDRLWIVAFATSVAIASKSVFRIPTSSGSSHFLNPSNLGLTTTFLLFPSVGVTMPWQWTTELSGAADWAFPVLVFALGTVLHLKYADRLWVVVAFLVTFLGQALFRGVSPDVNVLTALAPLSGVPLAIFTFYMVPDPATSPCTRGPQIVFGAGIAFVYMVLMLLHVVFALIFALTIACIIRGIAVWVLAHPSPHRISAKRDFAATESHPTNT